MNRNKTTSRLHLVSLVSVFIIPDLVSTPETAHHRALGYRNRETRAAVVCSGGWRQRKLTRPPHQGAPAPQLRQVHKHPIPYWFRISYLTHPVINIARKTTKGRNQTLCCQQISHQHLWHCENDNWPQPTTQVQLVLCRGKHPVSNHRSCLPHSSWITAGPQTQATRWSINGVYINREIIPSTTVQRLHNQLAGITWDRSSFCWPAQTLHRNHTPQHVSCNTRR